MTWHHTLDDYYREIFKCIYMIYALPLGWAPEVQHLIAFFSLSIWQKCLFLIWFFFFFPPKWLCEGFESDCIWTSSWAPFGWYKTTAWTSWSHSSSGLVDFLPITLYETDLSHLHYHQSLVPTMLAQLHELFLFILIYHRPNPWKGCKSLDFFLFLCALRPTPFPWSTIKLYRKTLPRRLMPLLACIRHVQPSQTSLS